MTAEASNASHSASDGTKSSTRNFLKFVFFAGLSVPVNLGARALLSLVVRYELAVVLSHLVGMAVAYVLTRRFVFGSSGRGVTGELGRFAVVNAVSLGITWTISVGLVRIVFPAVGFTFMPELIAHGAGLFCAAVSSYVGHRRFSFASA
jgi:putative flippase GtrA